MEETKEVKGFTSIEFIGEGQDLNLFSTDFEKENVVKATLHDGTTFLTTISWLDNIEKLMEYKQQKYLIPCDDVAVIPSALLKRVDLDRDTIVAELDNKNNRIILRGVNDTD